MMMMMMVMMMQNDDDNDATVQLHTLNWAVSQISQKQKASRIQALMDVHMNY